MKLKKGFNFIFYSSLIAALYIIVTTIIDIVNNDFTTIEIIMNFVIVIVLSSCFIKIWIEQKK